MDIMVVVMDVDRFIDHRSLGLLLVYLIAPNQHVQEFIKIPKKPFGADALLSVVPVTSWISSCSSSS